MAQITCLCGTTAGFTGETKSAIRAEELGTHDCSICHKPLPIAHQCDFSHYIYIYNLRNNNPVCQACGDIAKHNHANKSLGSIEYVRCDIPVIRGIVPYTQKKLYKFECGLV